MKETEKNYEDYYHFFKQLLSWGSLDIDSLMNWVSKAEIFDLDFDTFESTVEDCGFNKFEINSWFYAVIDRLFWEICSQIESYIDDTDNIETHVVALTVCEKCESEITEPVENHCLCVYCYQDSIKERIEILKNDFSPFINCFDSCFSNCFDELDFDMHSEQHLPTDSEEVIKQAIELLLKNVEV